MNFKYRSGILPSRSIADTGAGKRSDSQDIPVKAKGLKPISEELEGISGGRDDDGRHKPPRV